MNLRKNIQQELEVLFTIKQTKRKWQIPILAAICVGIPLLTGYYFDNLKYGLIASLSGMVILYLPDSGSLTNRIITVLICSFGFMISFAVGQFFSFNCIASAIALGVFSLIIHWVILYYKTSPPRSFFFILITSISICQPFNLTTIPAKIGLLGLGTMLSCMFTLIYTFYLFKKNKTSLSDQVIPVFNKNTSADFWEAIIMGVFMSIALAIGYLLEFENPYWIPISCAAVMQGASLNQIRQRTFHRILGTFFGLVLCWVILSTVESILVICFFIIILQLIVEILVVRHYALAVVFITPLAILLTEASNPLIYDPNTLIPLRFWETLIGSILGTIGGWIIYKEKIRYATVTRIQKISAGLIKNRYQAYF